MTQEQLDGIIEKHRLWLESEGIQGEQANFSEKYLTEKFPLPSGDASYLLISEHGGVLEAPGPCTSTNSLNETRHGIPNHFCNLSIDNANLERANFSGAVIGRCNITNSRLDGCNFTNAIMVKVHFSQITYGGFSGISFADFSGAIFSHCKFVTAFFQNNILDRILFHSCDLNKASLHFAKITNCKFTRCAMQNAGFSKASIFGSSFRHTNLEGANLSESSIIDSDFSYANCSKVDFTSTAMHLCCIAQADMSGANITNMSWNRLSLAKRFGLAVTQLFKNETFCPVALGCKVSTATGNESLKRVILDEAYVEEKLLTHPKLTTAWLILCDCGRSLTLWVIWVVFTILAFSLLIYFVGPDNLIYNNSYLNASKEEFITALYFTIVTFTTLGFGDISPTTPFGMLLVMIGAIAGLVILSITTAMVIPKLLRG